MQILRTILIDDDVPFLIILRTHLKLYCPQVKIVAECNTPLMGLEAIDALQPDLVFLDIEMPLQKGFQLIDSVPNINFTLIFTTSYDSFALKAFKYNALDYLLKPIVVSELIIAVQKATEKKYLHPKQIEIFQDSLNAPPKRIALSFQDGYTFIAPEEIVYCEAESNYTKFYLQKGNTLVASKTLKDVEDVLTDLDFFRIHRQYLINLKHIEKYIKNDGGYVVMSNQIALTIAQSRKEDFAKLFARF